MNKEDEGLAKARPFRVFKKKEAEEIMGWKIINEGVFSRYGAIDIKYFFVIIKVTEKYWNT